MMIAVTILLIIIAVELALLAESFRTFTIRFDRVFRNRFDEEVKPAEAKQEEPKEPKRSKQYEEYVQRKFPRAPADQWQPRLPD